MAHVGLGDIDAARNAIANARQLAPEMLANRLEEGMPTRDAAVRQRWRMMLRVAAGKEEPSAANAMQ